MRILALWGTPEIFQAEPLARHPIIWAENPSDAAKHLSEARAEVLVLNGDVAWHRTFAANLSPERRPAILTFGGQAEEVSAIADEWISARAEPSEVALRMSLAYERARARRQSVRRNFVDHLTGLPNRRAIVRALIREAVRARRHGGLLSLAVLDLDDFKRVNDSQGHSAGDKLLRRVGAALGKVTRANELCGRLGGDEFAIVVGGSVTDARHAVERAMRALAEVGISAGAGIAEWAEGEQLRELYRRADEALKVNKVPKRSTRRPQRKPFSGGTGSARTQAELFEHSPPPEVTTGQ